MPSRAFLPRARRDKCLMSMRDIGVMAPVVSTMSGETRAPWESSCKYLPFFFSTLVLWGWHIPIAYDLALTNVAVYWLMQVSLLGSAIWFWRAVLAARSSAVESLLFVVAAFAQMGLLGALLTFAPQSLYAAHAIAPFAWGVSPLEDQQLGGLIMWMPSGLVFIAAALVEVAGYIRNSERRAQRREQTGEASTHASP